MGVSRYFFTLINQMKTWILNTWGSLGIMDFVDILIVAFLIYHFIQFLRRSRLAMVAKSIAILILVVWISGRLNLLTVNYFTNKALELGILALVILFQPEIRQILERFGSSNLTGLFVRKVNEEEIGPAIDQTVAACVQMAKTRTGALIVFERNVSLEEEIKTGTRIEARLSAELLKNIFYDKAPLHDGAVIVREGKIVSAGCMLPLSDNANLSRDLGMRHRAGIGMSEKSDAVAVIVSEESGSISVATDGMLKRHLAQDTFRQILRNELLVEESGRNESKIRKLFKRKRNHEKGN